MCFIYVLVKLITLKQLKLCYTNAMLSERSTIKVVAVVFIAVVVIVIVVLAVLVVVVSVFI